MRYIFHHEFFRILQESEDSRLLWGEIADAFEDIWELCLQKAPLGDLDAHLPTVEGLSPAQLANLWANWQTDERVRCLRGLADVLEAEAMGDQQRGRRRLAQKLRQATKRLKEAIGAMEA